MPDVITAKEIRLMDAEGNLGAVLRVDSTEAGATLIVSDKSDRPRIRIRMLDQEPDSANNSTVLTILDTEGGQIWYSQEPAVG